MSNPGDDKKTSDPAKEQTTTTTPSKPSYRDWLSDNIAADILLEAQLTLLAVGTGINDAATYADWHIYVSNQTGNTVLLAVSSLDITSRTTNLDYVGVALGGFLAGGLVMGQLGDAIGQHKRGWLLTTNFIQTVLVFMAAALQHWYVSPFPTASTRAYAPIFLLAFMSGAQVGMARSSGITEIPTAMVTSAYVDFLVDPEILGRNNRGRNRRLVFVASLVGGAFIGAIAFKYGSHSLPYLLSALLKTVVTISFVFNKAASQKKVEHGTKASDPSKVSA